jgi:hypothetical protein
MEGKAVLTAMRVRKRKTISSQHTALRKQPSLEPGSPPRRKGREGILSCDPIVRGDWITELIPSGVKLNYLFNGYGTEEGGSPDTAESFLFGGLSPPNKKNNFFASSASLR